MFGMAVALCSRMKVITYILVLLFSTSAGAATKNLESVFDTFRIDPRVAECVATMSPDIGLVQELALKYSRINPTDISDWKKKVKKAALLPRLQFAYQRHTVNYIDLNMQDQVSVTGSGVNVGPTASDWTQRYNNDNNIEVTAVWYLDELVFNRDELAVADQARSQMSARRDLMTEVNENFYDLKKMISLYLTNGADAKPLRGNLLVEIERKVGNLNAMTGGWFSRNINWKGAKCE